MRGTRVASAGRRIAPKLFCRPAPGVVKESDVLVLAARPSARPCGTRGRIGILHFVAR